ncbi:unnamed protein product, partial [Staurois parvus]
MGPLLTRGSRAVPGFPNGQSAPGWTNAFWAMDNTEMIVAINFPTLGPVYNGGDK